MKSKLSCFRLLLTVMYFFITTLAISQKTVTGKVTNQLNEPIVGATITVKGTQAATQTNADGSFSISVPNENASLIVTSVGFLETELPVRGNTSLMVSMRESTSSLSEVVVTGYSSQAKKDITGSVAVVNVKELVANPGSNIQSLLQGRAAGVTVGTSGVPGAGSNVRIHGYSTFGNNEPLYIVDGARVGAITELNPNDIETMQVLKDASAASIYGSAAAGGVIIITTKKGKTGQPRITYDSYYGRQTFKSAWI